MIAPPLLLLLLALACSPHRDDGASVTVADSGGVRVVDNRRPRWSGDSAWFVDTAPRFIIGADATTAGDGPADRAVQFSGIVDALRTRNGGVAVVDHSADEIRYFDSTGRYLRTAGRRGDGPGEFRTITGLIRVPEGLLATTMIGRNVVYDDSGRFVRTFSSIGWDPFGAFANGVLVARKGMAGDIIVVDPASTPKGVAVDSQELHTVHSDGSGGESLGNFPRRYSVPFIDDESGFISPTGRTPLTFSAQGFEAVSGRMLYSAFGDRAEVVAREGGKRVTMIARLSIPTLAVDGSHRRKLLERRLIDPETGKPHTGEVETMIRKRFATMTFADSFPRIDRLVADSEGLLWIRHHRPAAAVWDPGANLAPTRWSVIDSAGHWLTDVTLPGNFGVTEIGSDYVLGVARDADGVNFVRLYTLRRGPR